MAWVHMLNYSTVLACFKNRINSYSFCHSSNVGLHNQGESGQIIRTSEEWTFCASGAEIVTLANRTMC